MSAAGRRDGVLVVGQGAPARGGIPTYIATMLGDQQLRERVPMTFLNTTRSDAAPGALSRATAAAAVRDLGRVFHGARRARIVHLHLAPAPLLPLLRACALAGAARAAGATVVVHTHSGRMHIAAARSAAYRAALRLLVRVADRIVVVSEDGAGVVRAAGGAPILLGNAVDADAFSDAAPGTTRSASLVFVGTVCERKGLDDLRVALLRLRDQGGADGAPGSVTIVGDGRQEGPGAFERMRDAYAASNLSDVVRFTGALPPDEVRLALASAGVFCLPSHWEGLPISLLEAMAAGCAVIATRVGQIPDVVGDAGLLVDPHDPAGLATAIRALMTDAARRTTLGEAARARVRDAYGLDAMREGLVRLYAGLGYSR